LEHLLRAHENTKYFRQVGREQSKSKNVISRKPSN